MPSPDSILGYCTNVHTGTDYASTLDTLDRYAVAVKKQVSPNAPMGVGLWLPASTAQEVIDQNRIPEFRAWLDSRGLMVFTMNGFPFGDFHQTVVKHAVYHPTWADTERLDYTLNLVRILTGLLPEGAEGSISTLPIGWPDGEEKTYTSAAKNLLKLVDHLEQHEADTGHCIHIDIEPEPGCIFDTSADIIAFFEDILLGHGKDEQVLRYLRVCHDVCHAAVMGETQADILTAYKEAGLKIGKVQLSAAVKCEFSKLNDSDIPKAIAQLSEFQEERYLHQTMLQDTEISTQAILFEDLPLALKALADLPINFITLRTHFHVPIFLDRFGHLRATQQDVIDCLELIDAHSDCKHFEVETYAWNVLPDELQATDLAQGIAQEMQWVLDQCPAFTKA
jgi:sugar phosphate isomerase/epimerase